MSRSPTRSPTDAGLVWPAALPKLVLLASALGTASCLADPVPQGALVGPKPTAAGFFEGIAHGAGMLLHGARRIAGSDAALFDVVNTGWWYLAGYLLGSMAFGSIFFGLLRLGIQGALLGDMSREVAKAIANAAVSLGLIGVSFVIADAGRRTPALATFAPALQPESCGVAVGAWHRITGLFSLAGNVIFDDVTIYQAGCGMSYDIGYILPQSLLILASFVLFGLGLYSSR